MKKLLSIVLSFAILFGSTPRVFATIPDTTKVELTEEQKVAREAFLTTYEEEKIKLEALRTESETLIKSNNDLSKEIKTILQGKWKNKTENIKGVGTEIKALAEKARLLNKQRIEIRAEGIKNKDKKTENSPKIQDITNQINGIREQIKSINNGNKAAKEEVKALKEKVTELINKEKDLKKQIESLREEKETYWSNFREDLNSNDYTKALIDYKKIIETKSKIVDLLKQRQVVLNQILAALK